MGVKDLAPPPEILRLSRSLKTQDYKTCMIFILKALKAFAPPICHPESPVGICATLLSS
jgi:hypothetical protein